MEKEQLVLEEVLVTANRRVESIQEVPMSVSAFTGEFFDNTGVKNLSDLEQYTPSLKITPGVDSRSTSIRIRGIGSVGTNVGIDPSVGMFIDGVYQGRAGMSVIQPDRHRAGRGSAWPPGHSVRQEHRCRGHQHHYPHPFQ